MTVTRNDIDDMTKLKTYLASEFVRKDLGGLKYFLGIEVARSKHGIFLSLTQQVYVDVVLRW